MGSPLELFSIVALGVMNPAIHHPQWYRDIGTLSDEEVSLALASANLMASAAVSQFSFGTITMTCVQPRWALQTTDEAHFPRVVEIAKKVMDTLDHTPVSAVGINCDFCRPSGVPDVGAFVAKRVQSLDLGLQGDPANGLVKFMFKQDEPIATAITSVTIAADPEDATKLHLQNNLELRIKIGTGRFQFGRLLDEHVPRARHEGAEQLQRTLAALRRAGA